MSFNKVILMGHLTRDPEYRVTDNGHQICKFGIALNRRFTTKSGEQREETTFVDVDAFGRQGETISKYFTKGKPILVEGRLRMDEWENQQGERRSKLMVNLESFSFVSDGQGGQGGGGAPAQTTPVAQAAPKTDSDPQPQEPASQDSASKDGDDGDDVPF